MKKFKIYIIFFVWTVFLNGMHLNSTVDSFTIKKKKNKCVVFFFFLIVVIGRLEKKFLIYKYLKPKTLN